MSSKPATPHPLLKQVVSDGTNLYGLVSDSSIWVAVGHMPLNWSLLPPVPIREEVISIGVTLGPIFDDVSQKVFAVCKSGSFWSWNGTTWSQRVIPSII
jgi:hypothetical protein